LRRLTIQSPINQVSLVEASHHSVTFGYYICSTYRAPFPSLESAFTEVDKDLGFFIELKYPQEMFVSKYMQEMFVSKYMQVPSNCLPARLGDFLPTTYLVSNYIRVTLTCDNSLQDGSHEDGLSSYIGRNEFLDPILRTIYKSAGNRRVILASFDPDICIM